MPQSVYFIFVIIISLFVAYVAYQQYQLQRKIAESNFQKVKWELYEKRYNIYYLTKEMLRTLTADNTIDLLKLRDFNFSTRERHFLFETEIDEYIDTIIKNGIDITHQTEQLRFPNNIQNYQEFTEEHFKLVRWFSYEYQENIESRFIKYLNFKTL